MRILSLGSWAQAEQSDRHHFSLLIEIDGEGYLIDPSVLRSLIPPDIELKAVLITQIDKDHYTNLMEYKDKPIFTSNAILEKLILPNKFKIEPIFEPLDLDGGEIKIFAVTHKIGTPSIGLRVDEGASKVSIVPEFLELGKAERNLMQNTIWVVGCGDYDEDDEIEGKLSFVSLVELAKELTPQAIYLTNKRKSLIPYEAEINKRLEEWNGYILEDGDVLEFFHLSKARPWVWYKPAYRIFSLDDLQNTPHFAEGDAVMDSKFDGLRMQAIKQEGKVEIWTDPDEVKEGQSANKTDRLPWIIQELNDLEEDNFRLDAEIIMIKENEGLHRTVANALVNGEFDPLEPSKMAHLEVFDILEFRGDDVRDYPLKERIECLATFKNSEHVHFIVPQTDLNKPSLSYRVKLEDRETLDKAFNQIASNLEGKLKGYPKAITEGVMVKLLNYPYETPQNHGVCKFKMEWEVDGLVVYKKQIIQLGKPIDVWNYVLAVGPISEEHALSIQATEKNRVIKFKDKYYNVIGTTDNTSEDVEVGSILRVAAEDVNEYTTKDNKFNYYGCYVMRVKRPVPEKDVPDPIFTLKRLAEYTGERISLAPAEVKKNADIIITWKGIDEDVRQAREKGYIEEEVYKKYATPNNPLPAPFYPDCREGRGWAQMHIRGLDAEEVQKHRAGKLTLAKLIENHSMHIDLRMSLGLPTLIQWVITEDSVASYFNVLKGLIDPETGNVAKALAIVKPSAEEPQKRDNEAQAGKEKTVEGALLDEEGAKLVAEIAFTELTLWLPAGSVGATPYKDAALLTFWLGNIKAGLQREDVHEYFLYIEECKVEKILNGRYLVRAFKAGKDKRWWFWAASEDPYPMDPFLHKAQKISYYPVPAEKVERFGREAY